MEPTEDLTLLDQALLESQLADANAKIDGFAVDLRGIDDEFAALAPDRRLYELLEQVCGGLEELTVAGGARLFWGEEHPGDPTRAYVAAARGRTEALKKQLGEVEDRREVVLECLDSAQLEVELLEEDLYDALQREESRRHEWLIEREVDNFPARLSIMPWSRGAEDDRRFRKTLLLLLLGSVVLGLVLPLIDLPIPGRWEVTEVPERLTRLIREAEPEPLIPQVPRPETRPEDPQELAKETKEAESAPSARPAARKGILAFREKFSGLAQMKSTPRLGADARIRASGEAASGRSQRALITSQTPGSSGGIDVGTLSRDTGAGGAGIEGVEVARATSSIGGAAGSGVDRPLSNGPGPSRTDEEIQIVFDRHKAALYRLYNRELRRDPTLRGQMVLRVVIEPDGSVSLCEIQSSDLNAPNLSAQVAKRVERFDFGAKEDVSQITILYPIDFLPAT